MKTQEGSFVMTLKLVEKGGKSSWEEFRGCIVEARARFRKPVTRYLKNGSL